MRVKERKKNESKTKQSIHFVVKDVTYHYLIINNTIITFRCMNTYGRRTNDIFALFVHFQLLEKYIQLHIFCFTNSLCNKLYTFYAKTWLVVMNSFE